MFGMLRSWGKELQIVDDVLDYEQDIEASDTNCLASPRAQEYLDRLISSDMRHSFPQHTLLRQTIERARLKARLLLKNLTIP